MRSSRWPRRSRCSGRWESHSCAGDNDREGGAPGSARRDGTSGHGSIPRTDNALVGVLFLRLENFSTTKAAEDAATSASAVVEWAGKIWLFTLGPMGVRSSGGTLVAEIGPVPDVPAAASYVLDVNEADFGPEMKAQVAQQVHTHPGPEIFYLLTGEQCLETPNGTTRARAGEGMVAPAHTPMQLNIMGSSKRDAFFVVVRDATKPRVTPSDWQPTGTCK